jgi:hypothetical protein
MRVRASSTSAVVASLLINDALAAVHGRHEQFHRKRAQTDVTVTDEVVETKTEVIYVTIEWPGGETLGVAYPPDMPSPAASTTLSSIVPQYTASSAGLSVTDTFAPASTSSVYTHVVEAQFSQQPTTTSTPPAAVPTTMATVVKAASTSAAAAPAPASGPSYSSMKRGLAYNDPSFTQYFTGGISQVSWAYNWGQTGPGLPPGLEYVPCLWSNDPSRTSPWAADASAAIASGTGHLFSFNEPDLGNQANMDIQTAVSAYQQFMEPFAGKAKLGAPAVTNGGGQSGLQYMENFISSCTGCTIDFVNIHWYDSASNVEYFKAHVEQAYTMGGSRPVWITEFAGSGTIDEQNTFLETVLPWLDAQPYVERYAYFMVEEGSLLSADGLSLIGSTFADYT